MRSKKEVDDLQERIFRAIVDSEDYMQTSILSASFATVHYILGYPTPDYEDEYLKKLNEVINES